MHKLIGYVVRIILFKCIILISFANVWASSISSGAGQAHQYALGCIDEAHSGTFTLPCDQKCGGSKDIPSDQTENPGNSDCTITCQCEYEYSGQVDNNGDCIKSKTGNVERCEECPPGC